MNILFLSQVLPYPLDAGPKVRAYYVLRHLATRHSVTLLCFSRPTDPPAAVQHLRSICNDVHCIPIQRSLLGDAFHLVRSLPGSSPFLIARDWRNDMGAKVRELVRGEQAFDVVHADQLWMAPYARLAQLAAADGRRPAFVLDQHNAVFQIPERLATYASNPVKRAFLRFEAQKLLRYEADICQQATHVVWVTEEDLQALSTRGGKKSRHAKWLSKNRTAAQIASTLIPICSDPSDVPAVDRVVEPYRVTFLGGLHWPPNADGVLWFASKVWPQISAQLPFLRLTVIGKNPPKELYEIEKRSRNNGESTIDIMGYVEDPIPHLCETAAFVVPLHAGGGMRVKILDAWKWGLPVVSTTIGAEGIAGRDGENLLLADSVELFAQQVVHLVQDPVLADRLVTRAHHTVQDLYNWRTTYSAWDEVYRQLLGERPIRTEIQQVIV